MKPVLRFVLTGTRGGPDRIRILLTLWDRPLDVDQLAAALDIDYTSVRNHLDTLADNDIVMDVSDDDVGVYLPTDQAHDHCETIEEIADRTDIECVYSDQSHRDDRPRPHRPPTNTTPDTTGAPTP